MSAFDAVLTVVGLGMLHVCVCGKHPGSTCSTFETVWAFRCKVVGQGTEGRSSGAACHSWVLFPCRRPSRRPVEELKVTLLQAKLEQTIHQEQEAFVSVALMSGTSQ